MMRRFLIVGVAGAVGAGLRYGLTLIIPETDNGFPVPTLLINLIGAFLLTFAVFYLFERMTLDDVLKTAISVGLLGSFTTFSAMSLETVDLINHQQFLFALVYIALSILGGLFMSFLGYSCQKLLGERQ
jgi:CrcB protein